jgi:hypothetical protein
MYESDSAGSRMLLREYNMDFTDGLGKETYKLKIAL